MAAAGTHLLRSAVLLVGDRRDADDIVQIALERTYRSWSRVRRADNPEAYVQRILVNSATDAWRRNRRHAHTPLSAMSSESRHLAAVTDEAGAVDLRDMLLRGLAELSAEQRTVVVLRYFWDLSEAETAATLGCSTGTVKSRASRALSRMRTSPNFTHLTRRSSA